MSGIEYIYDECPHVVGSTTLWYKELLNTMEEQRPGAKLQFYLGFLQAKAEGVFAAQADRVELHPCDKCGQPTSAPGECSFCRMWEKVQQVKGARLPAEALRETPLLSISE